MARLWCWTDVFVYRECCDTLVYGPRGLPLCFGPSWLSFERCCPPPPDLEDPVQGVPVEVVNSWWEGEHRGCRSRFRWVATGIAYAIHMGPRYDRHTGEILEEPGNATAAWARQAMEDELVQHLGKKDLSFPVFLQGAAHYNRTRTLSVEFWMLMHETIFHFGEALHECPQAALLAGFLKAEALFDRDRGIAAEMTGWLRTLLARAEHRQHVAPRATWGGSEAFARLEARERRRPPRRRLTLDLVVPLCSKADLAALSESLRQSMGGIPELIEPAAGAAEGSPAAGLGARARLQIYDVCGTLHRGTGRGARSGGAAVALAGNLSGILFGSLSAAARRLFGGGVSELPRVYVDPVEEEVPTGDVAVYLHHFAAASSAGTLADVTLMLHPDFVEHVRHEMLERVLGAMASGAWPRDRVDFLYLGWRHEGPTQADGLRVAPHAWCHCEMGSLFRDGGGPSQRLRRCDGDPAHPLARRATFGDYNPVLLGNLWRLAFGRAYDPVADNFGGFDFSQLLVSRRAVLRRPPSYWRYLSRAVSARGSFELLPGTHFVSRRVDLSPNWGFNKGVCIWFEHLWHLLLDPRFFPERRGGAGGGADLRAYTRLGDPDLPLGLRMGPDSVLQRHYWLSASEQCGLLRDHQGCHLAQLAQVARGHVA